MVLAFGGILFFLVLVVVLVVIGWAVLAYMRGTVKAAEEGLEPAPEEHPDAGHVAGPEDEHEDAGHVAGPRDR